MDINELLRKVKRIQINSKRSVNNLFFGGYRSAFKGHGLEFSEVRKYVYGDDIRYIDWNVSSRTNDVYIKLMQEEKENNLYILIENSSSMLFGGKKSKKDIALEITALFSYSASLNNDRVGVVIYNADNTLDIPLGKGIKQTYKILRTIIELNSTIEYTNKSNFNETLIKFLNTVKRKSTVIVISDFLNDQYIQPFKALCKKHHVIPILLIDDLESNYIQATYKYYDNNKLFSMKKKSIIKNEYENKYILAKKLFKEMNINSIVLSSGEDYMKKIMEYFRT
jgi:uncharacterized protein (DUF58 family)